MNGKMTDRTKIELDVRDIDSLGVEVHEIQEEEICVKLWIPRDCIEEI